MTAESHPSDSRSTVRWIGLIAGPALAALTFFILPEAFNDIRGESVAFTHAGRVTAALAVWMATWWLTEALPLAATALLPVVALPLALAFGEQTELGAIAGLYGAIALAIASGCTPIGIIAPSSTITDHSTGS